MSIIHSTQTESLPSLQSRRATLEEEIIHITNQIEMAEARKEDEGIPLDHSWMARAKAAMRYKRLNHVKLSREISALEKLDRAAKHERHQSALVASIPERLRIYTDALIAIRDLNAGTPKFAEAVKMIVDAAFDEASQARDAQL